MTTIVRSLLGSAAILAIVIAGTARHAEAQPARAPFVIRVGVSDSASKALDAAEVLIRSGRRTIAAGRTGPTGVWLRAFTDDSSTFEIVVRKLGFRSANRFLRLAPGDTVDLSVSLGATVQELSTVRVTARESLRRRSYFLDSETIANSRRPIRSALDAIVALRPSMLTSIGGRRVCGLIQEVWINGQRIPQTFMPDPRMENRLLPGVNPRNPVAPEILTILASVRPEHIQEMSYIDCFGGPVHALGSRNAVFIVLKEGIEYRWPIGTFVVGDSTSQI